MYTKSLRHGFGFLSVATPSVYTVHALVPYQQASHAWVYRGSHRVFTDEIEQDGQSENIINQN